MVGSEGIREAAWMGAQLRGICVFAISFEAFVVERCWSRTLVRGCWVGVWENLLARGRMAGLVF